MSAPNSAVVCAELYFAWPAGSTVFDQLNATFGTGRTRLIGRNGSGKSTLLRLIAGSLPATAGTITVSGPVTTLSQQLSPQLTVAELLGIAEIRAALQAITSGDPAAEHFATVGDDWDVEDRALAVLDRLNLPADLDRSARQILYDAVADWPGVLIIASHDRELLERPRSRPAGRATCTRIGWPRHGPR